MTDLGTLPTTRTGTNAVRVAWETGLYALSIATAVALGIFTGVGLIRVAESARYGAPWAHALAVLLFPLVGLHVLRWVAILAFAMVENLARFGRENEVSSSPARRRRRPRVSVLMPAFNEEETLEQAFRSLLELAYPDVEVVFVDDGSTDRTLDIARRFAGDHGNVRVAVHSKENGGKWSALNCALRHSTGELVLFVDADSHLDPQALSYLQETLEDRNAVAAAGYVRVRNRRRLLNWLQSLEYLTCNGSMRAAQSRSGTVLVVAGPIGLYRRAVLDRVFERFGTKDVPGETGPMEGDTFAEDFDLSLAVLGLGERIVYEPRAIAFTRAPESMCALLSQRYRWVRGSLQVLRKFASRGRTIPELMQPRLLFWLFACYFVDYALTPLMALLGVLFCLMSASGEWVLGPSALGLFALLAGSELTLTLCFASTHREQKRLALVLPLRGLYSGVFLMSILPFVVWDELRRVPMRW